MEQSLDKLDRFDNYFTKLISVSTTPQSSFVLDNEINSFNDEKKSPSSDSMESFNSVCSQKGSITSCFAKGTPKKLKKVVSFIAPPSPLELATRSRTTSGEDSTFLGLNPFSPASQVHNYSADSPLIKRSSQQSVLKGLTPRTFPVFLLPESNTSAINLEETTLSPNQALLNTEQTDNCSGFCDVDLVTQSNVTVASTRRVLSLMHPSECMSPSVSAWNSEHMNKTDVIVKSPKTPTSAQHRRSKNNTPMSLEFSQLSLLSTLSETDIEVKQFKEINTDKRSPIDATACPSLVHAKYMKRFQRSSSGDEN